jgi:hypothetical protein
VITQVTQLVEHAHGAMDFPRALLPNFVLPG